MDWNAFFDRTAKAAGLTTNADLAPKLGVKAAAVSHYRTGKRTPPPWVVAAALALQGHPKPQEEAARLMIEHARTRQERAFWRHFGVAAMHIMSSVRACIRRLYTPAPEPCPAF